MRFVLAVVTLVVAALLVLLGLGQRTVFAPPSSVTSSVTMKSDATVTVVSSAALAGRPGREDIHITGSKTAFAAYGRTSDVLGWVGDATYNRVSFDSSTNELVTKTVEGKTSTVPDPADSDLWYQQYSGPTLNFALIAPTDISLVIVSDGTAPAPSRIDVTWPLSTATPLVGPLVTAGLVVFLIGILLFIWAIAHHRRTRGPRRTSGTGRPPKLPRVERQGSLRSSRRAALGGDIAAPSGARGRKARRMLGVAPVVLLTTVALAGCSSDYWPQFASADASASATPTAVSSSAPPQADGDLQPPVVTDAQAARIVQRIVEVQTSADKNLDAVEASKRFMGPALDQRHANYVIRTADASAAAPVTIPTGKVAVMLPQQASTWPRTVFVTVQNADKTVVTGAMLVQETARDPYKVDYLVGLEAKATLPNVASPLVGAARLSPDVKLLTMQPDELAAAYADILKNGDASPFAAQFDKTGDTLRDKIGKPYKDAKAAKIPATASISYSSAVGPNESVAFATLDAGAIVSVDLDEIETVKPTKAGAKVNPEGEVKSLSKVTSTTKGIQATYGVQLLFSVPAVGSGDKIVLLGFSQALIAAKEVS